jgi:hypothetical protein
MAKRVFKQTFGYDYKGVDAESTLLSPDEEVGFARAVNLERSISDSIRGRVGCDFAGKYGFMGIFPYNYTRTQDQYDIKYQVAAGVYPNQTGDLSTTKTVADGASISKVVGINQQAWVLDSYPFSITNTGGSYSWYKAVSGTTHHFYIKKNGAQILDVDLNDGLTSTSTTIYSLLGSIDATADLAINRGTRGPCPPFAIVNGAQTTAAGATTTYGTRYTVTVANTPHTFKAGDIITFPAAQLANTGGLSSSVYGNPTLVGGFVISTTATTIVYVGQIVTLNDGDILGYMGQIAAGFPVGISQTASTTPFTLNFPYFRLIPEGDKDFGHLFDSALKLFITTKGTANATTAKTSFHQPPVAVSQDDCLFVAASGTASDGVDTFANNLIKIDGVHAKRAGLPAPGMLLGAPAAGVLTGTYKYQATFIQYDAQGNIIEGDYSRLNFTSAFPTFGTSITCAANYVHVEISFVERLPTTKTTTLQSNTAYGGGYGHWGRSCFKNTAEAPATSSTFFYVDDNTGAPGLTAFLQPGDPICLLDNVTQKTGGGGVNTGLWLTGLGAVGLGALHKTTCTNYCAQLAGVSPTISSITVADASGYTIPADSPISAGFTVKVYRTTAGGNQFYELCEIPVNGYDANGASPYAVVFDDNVNDSVLVQYAQWTPPTLGKEHNYPPPCSLVCAHQGGLVTTRSPANPNQVDFSTADGSEYFPLASNSLNVPSTDSGLITAIASDTVDRLAVLKERSYYDIIGDLDGGSFSVNTVTEGDYGVSSQASLRRVKDCLIGINPSGLVVIQNGHINQNAFSKLNAKLDGQDYYFNLATAFNDGHGKYVVSVPISTSQGSETQPIGFVVDYSKMRGDSFSPALMGNDIHDLGVKTFETLYPEQMDQAGGGVTIQGVTYHLSSWYPYAVFQSLPRFVDNSPSGNGNGDSFIDNTLAISYILEWNPMNLGEPGQLKTPIRFRLWSMPQPYANDIWIPYTVLVETGATGSTAWTGGSNINANANTLTFTLATDIFRDLKLKNCKTHFYILRLTTNTIRQSPLFTGTELMFDANYEKEDLIK